MGHGSAKALVVGSGLTVHHGRTLGLDKARSDARMQTVHQSSALGHGSAKALVVVSALTVH